MEIGCETSSSFLPQRKNFFIHPLIKQFFCNPGPFSCSFSAYLCLSLMILLVNRPSLAALGQKPESSAMPFILAGVFFLRKKGTEIPSPIGMDYLSMNIVYSKEISLR